jgi:hypothetical protein
MREIPVEDIEPGMLTSIGFVLSSNKWIDVYLIDVFDADESTSYYTSELKLDGKVTVLHERGSDEYKEAIRAMIEDTKKNISNFEQCLEKLAGFIDNH